MPVIFIVGQAIPVLVQVAVAITVPAVVPRIRLLCAILLAGNCALLNLRQFVLFLQKGNAHSRVGLPVRFHVRADFKFVSLRVLLLLFADFTTIYLH